MISGRVSCGACFTSSRLCFWVLSLSTPDEGSFLLGSAGDARGQAPHLQGAEQRGGHQPRAGERVHPRGLGARHPGRSAAEGSVGSGEKCLVHLVDVTQTVKIRFHFLVVFAVSGTERNEGSLTVMQRPGRNDARVSTSLICLDV